MEVDRIKELISKGTPLVKLEKDAAKKMIRQQTTNVFIKNGVHRSMNEQAFQQEVEFCSEMLYNDMMDDPRYKNLRDLEVPYIFSEGIKGRLGTDKDIVLTYKSLIRWVEGYVTSPVRKDAVSLYQHELKRNTPKLPVHEFTDDEIKAKVYDAWCEYVAYRKSKASSLVEVSDGSFKRIKVIGDISMPITCLDYGKIRLEYLVRHGYASDDETLVTVFERAYDKGGKFEKKESHEQ